MARHELYLCAHLRAAWTDVGGVGVVRRPFLTKIAKFSQGLVHLRLDPVGERRRRHTGHGAQHRTTRQALDPYDMCFKFKRKR